MIDIELLRNSPDEVKKKIATKRADPALVDSFTHLDREWRSVMKSMEEKRAEQKKLGEARKIEEAKKLKEEIKGLEEISKKLEGEREIAWIKIPNLPSDDTPVGKDENENKVLRSWGEVPRFPFKAKEHMDIGEALKIIDTQRASVVSGTRFGYLKGGAAVLEFALVQFAFDTLRDEKTLKKIAKKAGLTVNTKPFIPVVPPVMIKPDVYRRTGRIDPGMEDERYHLPKDDLYLIGSAEHTLVPMHMDETIPEGELPIRYVGFSTSFRREAGSYGKDTKGILRVHQFDKVEMESFTVPEDSRAEQEFLVAIQEYLMQELGLPYRVVAVCTGDMGGPDYRQLDIETWLPGQDRYRETHSSDLVADYQPRRLNMKVKRTAGKSELLHVNDATCFAIGRMLIAIIENYQTEKGTVKVPKALQKYAGIKEIV